MATLSEVTKELEDQIRRLKIQDIVTLMLRVQITALKRSGTTDLREIAETLLDQLEERDNQIEQIREIANG